MNLVVAALLAAQLSPAALPPADPPRAEAQPAAKPPKTEEPAKPLFQPTEVKSTGSVTVDGKRIAYRAVAGTLVVHSKGWEDTDLLEAAAKPSDEKDDDKPRAEASMFYAAYFRDGVPLASRPITFLFNGGPGSSTVWLHMGAFGPVRVETFDERHTPAPYRVVNNDQSLLDVSDLVFIDAPGAGFSRIAGKDKEKAFYGVDQDIDAFAQFITSFLSKYGRWSSPKYVLGESYGTMRGAGLVLALQKRDVDLNGLILASDILNWDLVPDDPQVNPGIDLAYVVSLPTYAATAWYHNRITRPAGTLQSFLDQVETYATSDYALALMKGNELPAEERQRVAERLSAYTGLPVPYLLKTNLRIEYGAFQKELLADQAMTTGTLDTRFVGATLDPLSKIASYDPQGSAITGAYVAAFNDYVRQKLRYGEGMEFKSGIDIYSSWDYKHQPPGADKPLIALPNVLPDLAVAMKQNPSMKVMVNGGYYDVSTPYFAGKYELRHLPVPPTIAANIEYHYFETGHMIFAHLPSLEVLHDRVGEFIRRTSGGR
jgi:carboxypeptidase C (cathepsin A)